MILASRDATDGALSDDARKAFTNLWALQMKTGELSGAWAWLNFKYEPWEAPRLALSRRGARRHRRRHGTQRIRVQSRDSRQRQIAADLRRETIRPAVAVEPGDDALGVHEADRAADAEQRDGVVARLVTQQRDDGGWAT